MEFASGKHLANYLLKIFKNNNVDIPKDYIEDIKDLEYVFNFITNLPNSIRRNIDFSDGYFPWIAFAQGSRYKKLSDISKLSNENISKFINNPSIISFDTVFKSFELGIKYNLSYLRTKPDKEDIYYPHSFEILDGKPKIFQWNIAYYTKPNIPKEDNIGCYFIYDNSGEIVYIGKSTSDLLTRACVSSVQRLLGDFKKIELMEFNTKAETNIFEIYYISKLKPKFNSESNTRDVLPFDLPDTSISKKYINAVDKKIFDSKDSPEFISYSQNAVSNGYIVFEKEKGHAYRPIIPLK